MKNKALKIANIILNKTKLNEIDFAFVLGSGLAEAMPKLENAQFFDYEKLGMGKSSVKGHAGKFVVGNYMGKNIILLNRFHYYECGDLEKVRLPFEVLKYLNVKLVVLTTASGALNLDFAPKDIVVIKDHINLTGVNPLMFKKPLEFVDTRSSYCYPLQAKLIESCAEQDAHLKQGVHVQFCGPTYETPAEVEYARKIGGDTVSMSTAHDIIVCASLGLKQLSFSCVTNKASTYTSTPITHEEVLSVGHEICEKLKIVFKEIIKELE